MNVNLSTAKLLGGIGAILFILPITLCCGALTGVIFLPWLWELLTTPYFEVLANVLAGLAGLAGIVLILISFNMFSKIYNDPQIFKNALISFLPLIVGGFCVTILFLLLMNHITSYLIFIISIISYLILIFSAHYLKSAFYLLSSYTGVNLFRTGGLCYFIGTILIITIIGMLINLVAWILIAVAFFTTPKEIKSEA